MIDPRKVFEKAEGPAESLDRLIAQVLKLDNTISWTTDYAQTIGLIEGRGYDWIMGNTNGHLTPFGCVGVHEKDASFSATPLMSLLLSLLRLELGDDRIS